MRRGLFIAIALSSLASEALTYAAEIREIYTPVRPTGMGGAFTAVANDENAVWTNPAGIARLRKARSRKPVSLVTLPNAAAGYNTQGELSYSLKNSETAAAETVANAAITDEKPYWSSFSSAPMIFFDIGGAPTATGVYSHSVTKIVPDQDFPTETDVEVYSDLGGILSFGVTNASNRLNFGVQARYLNRFGLESTVETASLADKDVLKEQFSGRSNSTTALAVDAGMMFTFADFWFPTFGISVINAPLGCKENYLNPFAKKRQTICGTVFSGDIGNDEALTTVDPTDIRAGFSITPRLSRKVGLRLAVDAQNMAFGSDEAYYGLPGIEPLKMFHGGAELFIGNPLTPSPLSVRIGSGQGFVSFGATMRLSALALEIAVYGRDISDSETPREDRRILGSLSLEY